MPLFAYIPYLAFDFHLICNHSLLSFSVFLWVTQIPLVSKQAVKNLEWTLLIANPSTSNRYKDQYTLNGSVSLSSLNIR